jgi:hypothetical protein
MRDSLVVCEHLLKVRRPIELERKDEICSARAGKRDGTCYVPREMMGETCSALSGKTAATCFALVVKMGEIYHEQLETMAEIWHVSCLLKPRTRTTFVL